MMRQVRFDTPSTVRRVQVADATRHARDERRSSHATSARRHRRFDTKAAGTLLIIFAAALVAACSFDVVGRGDSTAGAEPLGEVQSELINGSSCPYERYLANTTAAPEGAVGYLNNGCTATLISSRHILTAGHCLVNYVTNSWWTNLRFYPNYNGEGWGSGAVHIDVDRGVSGVQEENDSAVPANNYWWPSDWAIGHLATDAVGFPALPISDVGVSNDPVMVAHYTRDTGLWNQGEPTNPACCPSFVPGSNPPVCTACEVSCQTAPNQDELNAGRQCNFAWPGTNVWWRNGLISVGEVSYDSVNDQSEGATSGPYALGGSSGSPHLWDWNGYRIIGVTHHGNDCTAFQDHTFGPAARRFQAAPRYAANVAVMSAPGAISNTGVFVLDADRNYLTMRTRSTSGATDKFAYFTDVAGSPYGSACTAGSSNCRIAGFKLGGTSQPGLVVLNVFGALFEMDYIGYWTAWTDVSLPPSGGQLKDIDAAYDAAGVNILYAVGTSNGAVFRRTRVSGNPGAGWSPSWQQLLSTSDPYAYHRITAIKHHTDGKNQFWVLSTAGTTIRTRYEINVSPYWSTVASFGLPALNAGEVLTDLDAAWSRLDKAMLVVLTSQGRVFTRTASTASSGSTWGSWIEVSTELESQGFVNKGNSLLSTITASRFAETDGGYTVPVIVATDTFGNVYQTSNRCRVNPCFFPTWSKWLPFYGRRMEQGQTILD